MDQERITSEGRVMRVERTYAYIHSNEYGSVFVPPLAVGQGEGADIREVLPLSAMVRFVAVAQVWVLVGWGTS